MSETEIYGLVNAHRVDGKLFRSGEVSPDGIESLKRSGVKLIVCLKYTDKFQEVATERRLVKAAGIAFEWHPMNSSGIFSYDDGDKVPEILRVIDAQSGCVLVHCHKGSDRTGVVVACYRIKHYGISACEAIEEMKEYGAAWWNRAQRRFVEDFANRQAAASR